MYCFCPVIESDSSFVLEVKSAAVLLYKSQACKLYGQHHHLFSNYVQTLNKFFSPNFKYEISSMKFGIPYLPLDNHHFKITAKFIQIKSPVKKYSNFVYFYYLQSFSSHLKMVSHQNNTLSQT